MPDNPTAIDPALAETDAETLLLAWYKQWHDSDDMPPKMPESLHVRTLLYFLNKQHQRAIDQAVEMMPR